MALRRMSRRWTGSSQRLCRGEPEPHDAKKEGWLVVMLEREQDGHAQVCVCVRGMGVWSWKLVTSVSRRKAPSLPADLNLQNR